MLLTTSPQLLLHKETPISSGSATITAKFTTRQTAQESARPPTGLRPIVVCQCATVTESRSTPTTGMWFTPHLGDLNAITSGEPLITESLGQASPLACRKLQYSRLSFHHRTAAHFILAQRLAYSRARMEAPRGRRVMMDPPTPLSKSFSGWAPRN